MPSSKTKIAHIIHIRHRDEVERPFTDWLQEAYEFSGTGGAKKSQKSESQRAKVNKASGKGQR